MSGPRILCIGGSPRRHGNSDRLLDALSDGVREAGGTPVRLVASALAIGGCEGCGGCSVTGRCVVDDQMDEVYGMLDAAAAVAVATPVYFASVPSPLKALIDRCQPYWARRYVLGELPPPHKRPGAILVVGGGGDPFGTGCALAPVRSAFAVLGVDGALTLEVVGADAPADVERDSESLRRAASIGRALVAAVGEQGS